MRPIGCPWPVTHWVLESCQVNNFIYMCLCFIRLDDRTSHNLYRSSIRGDFKWRKSVAGQPS
jgi:hypothetical protein